MSVPLKMPILNNWYYQYLTFHGFISLVDIVVNDIHLTQEKILSFGGFIHMQSITKNTDSINLSLRAKLLVASSAAITSLLCSSGVIAQDSESDTVEEVVVTGIRASLASAIAQKQNSDNLIEVIQAVDIGKLPDQNLAEVLENITGVQITREAGVGTGVQIRGTGSNITLMNGVATVGSGNGRTGIDFEDVDASIISAVEVTKAPEAKTIEGALGGVINLKTIRPLDLKERLGSVRIQGETSSLSDESAAPKLSGAYGNNWSTGAGDFGFVVSGSYTESDVSQFRPRTDRDNLTLCVDPSDPTFVAPSTCDNAPAGTTHFLGAQFLNQVLTNQEYATTNLATSFEFAQNDSSKWYFDAILNDQERREEGHRAQASNISRLQGNSDHSVTGGVWTPGDNANFTGFQTYDLGSLLGSNGIQDLGSAVLVTQGTFTPLQGDAAREAGVRDGRGAPFLRSSSDASSRLTDSLMLRFGNEFEISDRLSGSAEVSKVSSDSVESNFDYTMNFINPNSYIAEDGDLLHDGVTVDLRTRMVHHTFSIWMAISPLVSISMILMHLVCRIFQIQLIMLTTQVSIAITSEKMMILLSVLILPMTLIGNLLTPLILAFVTISAPRLEKILALAGVEGVN